MGGKANRRPLLVHLKITQSTTQKEKKKTILFARPHKNIFGVDAIVTLFCQKLLSFYHFFLAERSYTFGVMIVGFDESPELWLRI